MSRGFLGRLKAVEQTGRPSKSKSRAGGFHKKVGKQPAPQETP